MKLDASERVALSRGCLLAGAVGDALGGPVEFLSDAQITQQFGPEGVKGYEFAYGRRGAITDDTQMTLFTAEGLIRAASRAKDRGICHPPSVVHHAYLRWLLTQSGSPSTNVSEDGWLIQQKGLFARRAPGNTCLSALETASHFGELAQNNSKGCGGVMRVAPVALYLSNDLTESASVEAYRLAAECCALTHGHPTGQIAGGAFAYILHRLLCGRALADAVADVIQYLSSIENNEETRMSLAMALKFSESKAPSRDNLRKLGEGWIAEEALGMGVYAALTADKLENGLLFAVNHGGDSDSTSSIAGNLLGLMFELDSIPPHWLAGLELAEVIGEVAEDLILVNTTGVSFEKYPGC
jgi:ADP-ribosyl-[dinitrogen reductase] hydrolase